MLTDGSKGSDFISMCVNLREPMGRGVPAAGADIKDLTLLRALKSEAPKMFQLMWIIFINVDSI